MLFRSLPHVQLTKTSHPALSAEQVEPIDAVLLSHDQHADNLDRSGKASLSKAARVLTTRVGAARLGNHAEGLAPWAATVVEKPGRPSLQITATPARHGPAGIEQLAGDVIGFLIAPSDPGTAPIYITGDTVWYAGVAEVARRFGAGLVLPFAGSARTRGPFHLTMDTNDVIETANAFPDSLIVPLHFDGWAHLTQGREDLEASFSALGFASRLRLLEPGVPMIIELPCFDTLRTRSAMDLPSNSAFEARPNR